MDSSLRTLVDRIGGLDEDTGFVDCTSIEIEPEEITIKIEFGELEEDLEQWQIIAKKVCDRKIFTTQDFEWVSLETDHPVLMPHQLPHQTLYFSTPPEDSDAVFAQLVSAQVALTDYWFPVDFFLRRGAYKTHQDFLRAGFGLLAIGPTPLIRAFQEVLSLQCVEHSFLSWGGIGWNGVTNFRQAPAVMALVAQQSYIVAEEFVATRI